ncbi:MAG: hypothetical protein JO317_08495 [Verrucomicrobiae bacterium]|nr:hypothetical protein [Verrucomicrobiae bacterium]
MKIPATDFTHPPVRSRPRWLRIWSYGFVLIALLTFLGAFYYIAKHQHWLEPYITFYSYLEDSEGVQAGDPIYLMGFKIGYVTKIDVGSSEPGHERQLVLIYKVMKAYHYYINQDSVLQVDHFLPGTPRLEITKGQVDAKTGIPLPDHRTDEPMQVVIGPTLGGIADKLAEVLDKVQDPKSSIGKLLTTSEFHDHLIKVLDTTSSTLKTVSGAIGNLNHELTANHELRDAMVNLSTTLESARTFIEGMKHHWLFRSAFKANATERTDDTSTGGLKKAKESAPAKGAANSF